MVIETKFENPKATTLDARRADLHKLCEGVHNCNLIAAPARGNQ